MKLRVYVATALALLLGSNSGCATSAPVQPAPEQPSEAAWNRCFYRELSTGKTSRCVALDPPDYNQALPEGEVRADFDDAAKKYILSLLKDPDSARIREVRPSRKGRIPNTNSARKPIYGWIACYGVNAKNSYGGYVGEQTWALSWDGLVWRKIDDSKTGSSDSIAVLLECRRSVSDQE